MDEISRTARCTQCGAEVPDDQIGAVDPTPCPQCGSDARTIVLSVFDSVGLSVHDNIRGKVREGSGKKGVKKEFFAGDDERRSKGDWVDKQRIIDRENDRYLEIVKDKETGDILHHCDEPLSEHWGHGSAKFQKKDKQP